ncbi:hypothetical protein AAFF_G00012160 [Aldrovandia affinis]|uniref:Uncharacterized protein n=1 Tax=Aldrovandia affinis TaxID=143900 RepID=A0AAD7S6N5_9TELE|nr:hypothetical protein AAFF_G00012160 [Aldrovandia affinis]
MWQQHRPVARQTEELQFFIRVRFTAALRPPSAPLPTADEPDDGEVVGQVRHARARDLRFPPAHGARHPPTWPPPRRRPRPAISSRQPRQKVCPHPRSLGRRRRSSYRSVQTAHTEMDSEGSGALMGSPCVRHVFLAGAPAAEVRRRKLTLSV